MPSALVIDLTWTAPKRQLSLIKIADRKVNSMNLLRKLRISVRIFRMPWIVLQRYRLLRFCMEYCGYNSRWYVLAKDRSHHGAWR